MSHKIVNLDDTDYLRELISSRTPIWTLEDSFGYLKDLGFGEVNIWDKSMDFDRIPDTFFSISKKETFKYDHIHARCKEVQSPGYTYRETINLINTVVEHSKCRIYNGSSYNNYWRLKGKNKISNMYITKDVRIYNQILKINDKCKEYIKDLGYTLELYNKGDVYIEDGQMYYDYEIYIYR